MGFTAQLYIKVDGRSYGVFCVEGNDTGYVGGTSLNPLLHGYSFNWHGADHKLEMRVDQLKGNDYVTQVSEYVDQQFALMRGSETFEHEIAGRQVLIEVVGLAHDADCSGAAQDAGASGDGGTRADAGAPRTYPALLDVHGTSANDVWAVGYDGVVLHFDGTGWTQTNDEAHETLDSVWASEPAGDLWIVATRVEAGVELRRLLRGRPGAFQEVLPGLAPGELAQRVWGTGPDDVWLSAYTRGADGSTGSIHHASHDTWTLKASGAFGMLDGIWGTSASDVFLAGNDGSGFAGGYIAHFANGQFEHHEYQEQWIGGIWGTAASDVWAVGGGLLHFDGKSFSETRSPTAVPMLHGVWGSAADDYWAVGQQGTTATGVSGVILHWDGASWTESPTKPLVELRSVWGTARDDVWAVGTRSLYHFDGSAWQLTPISQIKSAP